MELAKYIEHTNLKPNCTKEDIVVLCNEAIENGFYGICVPPYFVQLVKKTIGKKNIKIISVAGFPLGYSTVGAKVEEAKKAIISGADEIDMVMNIAAFKSGDFQTVQNDIQSVVTVCHLQNKKIKVIIETAYLSEDEIKFACKICANCEVDFVKTSTGYADKGAEIKNIKLIRDTLPLKIKIKAAGGIKTKKQAIDFINAGADVLGSSNSLKLIE
ncbi:MAG: deoxyribose-phosphate aldolase [Bacteroidota bacterium]|jgi:deoxyribose-phosphate aldolase